MECTPLDITLISAQGLQDVNHLFPMNVYAVVTINGYAQTEQKTPVHKHCGPNPEWNCTMKFLVDEAAANQDGLNLEIRLVSDRHRHCFADDKDIGKVVVSIREFLASKEKVFVRNVELPDGQPQGTLNLGFEIGEKLEYPAAGPSADPQPPRQPEGESFSWVPFGKVILIVVRGAVIAMSGVDIGPALTYGE
ncbi:hypothetical protein SLA2020_213150 [Shorea laevis]